MRVAGALDDAARRIGSRLEAELLLGRAIGAERVTVLAHPERELSLAQQVAFEALVVRREHAEPIAYLLGEREFYGHMFRVDRRALIPRPETELLVELGIEAITRRPKDRVVEVGTGSGAVAISLALAADCSVLATDVSLAALSLAKENARRLGANVKLIQSDLLDALRGPVDVILANLPYVPTNRQLPSDVRDYEPHVAIFGGPDGTELIQRLLRDARRVLAPGGEVAVELDEEEQAQPIACLARELYPRSAVTIHQDGGGYDRVVRVKTFVG